MRDITIFALSLIATSALMDCWDHFSTGQYSCAGFMLIIALLCTFIITLMNCEACYKKNRKEQ